MARSFAIHCTFALLCAVLAPASVLSQIIDFETLPGGASTADLQEISTQYAVYGVTFSLLDRTTGLPIGLPRIAKAGAPRTAFEGCFDADTPRPHLDLGVSFLTDGTELGVEGDLRIEYSVPVTEASGVILDIDCRTNGGPPCEQWTITAYDTLGTALQTVVLDGPPGAPNPECTQPEAGPGDAEAFGWTISTGEARIKSIVLRYTGAASNVGLAFDNFSVAGPPAPMSATLSSQADTICSGDAVELSVVVSGGLPPFTFQWQQETGPSLWTDLGTGYTQTVQPAATAYYRVIVADATASHVASDILEVVVASGDPLCAACLLVSSFDNDRVLRYSFRSRRPDVLVSSGSGGLDGPAEIVCGNDGYLYVVSQPADRVLRYDGATGAFKDIFVAAGSGGLDIPTGAAFGPDGNLYVSSYNTSSILRYNGGDGSFIDAFVPTGSGLNGPTGIVFDHDGKLYVASFNSDKVLRFDGETGAPLGDFVTTGSGGLDAPRGLIFGPDGNLYIAEQYNDSVRRYDGATGAFIDVFVAAGSGGLDRANDITFGPDGILYVASYNNDKMLCYDGESGAFLYELPNDFLDGPVWIAVGGRPVATGVSGGVPPVSDLRIETGVPNPFNPQTTVAFTLAKPGRARVKVIDVAGRVVATLLDRELAAGRHSVTWDGRSSSGRAVSSGVYFMCAESGGARKSAKMLLVR